MGVNPQLERNTTANRRLEGDLTGGAPVDENLLFSVDEHGGFEPCHDRKDVDTVPSPGLGQHALSGEQILVLHTSFLSGETGSFPHIVSEFKFSCIRKSNHALTSGNDSAP